MDYNSLIATKGTSGAIATSVSYSLLDIQTILLEAQALIFQSMRCREMRSIWSFGLGTGYCYAPLPLNFLDPIGRLRVTTIMTRVRHRDHDFVEGKRMYQNTTGTLSTNPLTTTNGSTLMTVSLPGNGFNQGGIFRFSGSTSINGTVYDGSYPIVAVGDTFTIDTGIVASASTTGGGSAITYSNDDLIQSIPNGWSIWDERLQFDCSLNQSFNFRLPYYARPAYLSVTNPTNFLTNRYPQILRTACQTSAADYMKDDTEYQKGLSRLQLLIASAQAENEFELRGLELETETP